MEIDIQTADQVFNWLAVFTLVALVLVKAGAVRWIVARVAHGGEQSTSTRQVVDDAQVVHPPQIVNHRQWWPVVVNKVWHLLIVGETQNGKSLTALALLNERAKTDQIIVIDPHGKLNNWPVSTVGAGRNFAAIDTTLAALEREMTRRYAPDESIGAPVSIFIDEWPAIADECKHAQAAFLRLAREGAKVGMRLVILTQDANVETLGIRGKGAARANFSMLLLGRFATQAMKTSSWDAWPAVLDHQGTLERVSRAKLPGIAQRPPRVSLWQAPATDDTPEPVPAPWDGALGGPGTGSRTGSNVVLPDTDALEPVIRRMADGGMSRNQIAHYLGGNRQATLRRIATILDATSVE